MKSILLYVLPLWAISAHSLVAAGQIRPINSTRQDRALSASTSGGEAGALARQMQADIQFPSGRAAKGSLFILFDPMYHHYYWSLIWAPEDSRSAPRVGGLGPESKIYSAQARLVLFSCGSGRLEIYESTESADSVDDAETKSLKAATDQLGEIEALRYRPSTRSINLGARMGAGFLVPPFSETSIGPVEIESIKWSEGKWELVLKGQWTARIQLDADYQLVGGATRLEAR
jgi:hypothetical protein